ncbi:MAG: DUF2891 family protein, partial [Planctomycetes bacterium]|nr:DUF2891 family protein [Planctomycetota bacterium]
EARAALSRSLTPANLAAEAADLNAPGRNTFERHYGLAWLLAKSASLRHPREVLAATPFVGSILRCIVCAAPWAAGLLLIVVPRSALFSKDFRVHAIPDVIVLVGWVLFSTWVIARLLHDAD